MARHVVWHNPASGARHNRTLLRDTDGRLFVNYLDETIFVAGEEAGPFLEEVAMHRDQVNEKLDDNRLAVYPNS